MVLEGPLFRKIRALRSVWFSAAPQAAPQVG